MLVSTPNHPGYGTYLVDVESGAITKIANAQNPLSVAFDGGYSEGGQLVYGTSAMWLPQRINAISLVTGDTLLLATAPAPGTWLGPFRLSPDGSSLAAQLADGHGLHVVLMNIATGVMTPIVDRANAMDTLQFGSLRWTPDGRWLYGVTAVYEENRTELIRIELATDRFTVISPTTGYDWGAWLDLSPDGRILAHGDGDGNVHFRDRNGGLLRGFPDIGPRATKPIWSPDGKFLAYQQFGPPPSHELTIMIMRLSDGTRWPLEIDADFEVWLSDWIPES
jgi:Tol biopolymer transport system component